MWNRISVAGRCAALLWALAAQAQSAWAAERDVWLVPTQAPKGGRQAAVAAGPAAPLEPVEAGLPGRIDHLLAEALRDYGLEPHLAAAPVVLDERALVEAASHSWVLSAEIQRERDAWVLRLVLVEPASTTLRVSRRAIEPELLAPRLLAQLRALLSPLRVDPLVAGPCPPVSLAPFRGRSAGRAVLAIHAAGLGGMVGYALQRAAGSSDPRLSYPLAAIGAGVGLGASVVVAEEWDITVARAWYLSAAQVWPALGVALLADGFELARPARFHTSGLMGASTGLGLALLGLGVGEVHPSGALLMHSTAGLSTLLGGLGEMLVVGRADERPAKGMGLGALGGVLAGGVLAFSPELPTSSELLFVDVGALLGGLVGAAVATPVIISRNPSPARERVWLGSVTAGLLAGTGLGLWLSDKPQPTAAASPAAGWALRLMPAQTGLGLSAVASTLW